MTPLLRYSVFIIACVGIIVGNPSCTNKIASEKPNVVLILADDLGYSQLGCNGSSYYQTPAIDQLAKEGMRFTNAYSASAVCSPTRASIMTGKYPARLHLTDFIPGDVDSTKKLLPPDWQKFLPLKEVTLAEIAKQQGYATGIFGKWHLSIDKKPPASLPYNPDKQGFDEYMVTYKPTPTQDPSKDAHNVDTITKRAIDFMERNQNTPFFLMVSHNSIHDPLKEKPENIRAFDSLDATSAPENHATIAAMLKTMDNSVNSLLNALNELQLTKQTMVIFYSDNGGKAAYAKQTPFRSGKGWNYEGGIHVPLIVRYPQVIPEHTITDVPVISNDLFPTLAEVFGDNSYKKNNSLDGLNILPVLKNSQHSLNRNTLYWHYPHYRKGSGMQPGGAIRYKNYKLIEWYEPKLTRDTLNYELYDLAKDPGESINLASTLPDTANYMLGLLEKWRADVDAQMPIVQ